MAWINRLHGSAKGGEAREVAALGAGRWEGKVSSTGVMLTVTCLAIFRWPHLNSHLCVCVCVVWFSFTCAVGAANHILRAIQ